MYDLAKIQSKFRSDKVVLFKEPYNVNNDVLDPDLVGVSSTNQYFNSSTHQYLHNFDNILSTIVFVDDFPYVEFSVGGPFKKGQIVRDSGLFYRSRINDNSDPLTNTSSWRQVDLKTYKQVYDASVIYALGEIVYNGTEYFESLVGGESGNPLTDTAKWKVTTIESIYLRRTIDEAIENILASTFTTSPLIDNEELWAMGSRGIDEIEPTGKLTGIMFWCTCSRHVSLILKQLGLHFVADQSITFKLFNQNTEIKEITIAYDGAGDFKWFDLDTTALDITMKDKEGMWYLFYDETDLIANNKSYSKDVLMNSNFNPFFKAVPFTANDISDINDFNKMQPVDNKNYGMNLNVTVGFDLTDFILQHLNELGEVVKLQWAMDMLEKMLFNSEVRTNRNERNVNDDLLKFDLKAQDGNAFWKKFRNAKKKIDNSLVTLSKKDNAFERVEVNNYELE